MPEAKQDRGETLKIRKYPNRRYYDATRSQHVTLEEIHRLVSEGRQVQVTDSKSGQDITPQVLAQIILELDASKLAAFPASLLHRIIQSNETILQDFVDRYFNQALSLFLDSRQQFEQNLRQWLGLAAGTGGMTPFANNPWMPMAWPGMAGMMPQAPSVQDGPAKPERHADQTPADAPSGPQREDEEQSAHDLRQQFAQLQQQMAALQAKLDRSADQIADDR